MIWPHRRRAQPHIPVQAGFIGLGWQIAEDARAADGYVDGLDFADDAVANQFARDTKFLGRTLHAAGLEHALVLANSIDHRPRLVDRFAKPLLAVHVLARFRI